MHAHQCVNNKRHSHLTDTFPVSSPCNLHYGCFFYFSYANKGHDISCNLDDTCIYKTWRGLYIFNEQHRLHTALCLVDFHAQKCSPALLPHFVLLFKVWKYILRHCFVFGAFTATLPWAYCEVNPAASFPSFRLTAGWKSFSPGRLLASTGNISLQQEGCAFSLNAVSIHFLQTQCCRTSKLACLLSIWTCCDRYYNQAAFM